MLTRLLRKPLVSRIAGGARCVRSLRSTASTVVIAFDAPTPTTTATGAAATGPMFCYQCEQTESHTGCTTVGVCGKTPEVAHLQDGMIHALKGLSHAVQAARALGVDVDRSIDQFWLRAMFSTLTNVNFDAAYFYKEVPAALALRDQVKAKAAAAAAGAGKPAPSWAGAASWAPATSAPAAFEAACKGVGVLERRGELGDEAAALHELVTYGVKGAAAYACHAMEAGKEDAAIYDSLHGSLALLSRGEKAEAALVAEAMRVGANGVAILAALDGAHTSRFGAPTPTAVNHAPVAGPAILISGHDMTDLSALLEQSAGKGVNVFTHGEMLPAHGYPKLKAHPHLKGHFGTAWQLQKFEYGAFPGPVVQTTNCLIEPRKSYQDRLFTTNATAFPGVKHIPRGGGPGGAPNFGPVIERALAMKGFPETKAPKTMLTGFGHDAVLGVAPAVLDAVSKGQLDRFVLIGGCDGSEAERSYYTKLAVALPPSSVILTLGCAKFRILGKKDYGNVPGTQIPRVLDMGQCNDAYSAVVVAQALAGALKTDVNGLPLSIVLSWLEQKAVLVLLSLLHLGVKNIRIGPSLPAFVTPKTLDFLVKTFALQPIAAGSEDGDVDAVMGKKKMAA